MSKTDEIIQNRLHHYWLQTVSTPFLHIHYGHSLTLNVNKNLNNVNLIPNEKNTIQPNPDACST